MSETPNTQARTVEGRRKRLTLSPRDFARLVKTSKNPPAASDRLRAAAREYQQIRRARPELNW